MSMMVDHDHDTARGDVLDDEPINQYEDYWGSDETFKHFLPDGKQYFVIKPMSEGGKARFQKMTTRDVVLKQHSDEAKISIDPASERHELIKESVVDWYLMQRDPKDNQFYPAPWAPRNLVAWLEKAPPHIVEGLEAAIRKLNPWLTAMFTVEEIDKEIERLNEERERAVVRERGEGVSANR